MLPCGSNLKMVKPLFEVLFQPGSAIEVRVVQPWCGSGFFDNAADLEEALGLLDEAKPDGVYCSLNPVTAEAFNRAPNQFRRADGNKLAASGADIASRKWILIDCDALRPKNVSATDEEKALALAKARHIRDYLLSEGAPQMVEADSGNGGHILLPCDLPNDKESTRLVRGFLEYLSARFTDERVKVDTVNFNADRITKGYGTMSRKGPDTPERPHRRSGIISLPPIAVPVARELLERMQLKPATSTAAAEDSSGDIQKLNHWAATIPGFPAIKRLKRDGDKVTVIPEHCYLNPDHAGTSAGIVFHSDGGRGNVCKHDGCNRPFAEWWADVEKLYGQPLRFDPELSLKKSKPTKAGWTLQNYAAIKVERVSWIFRNYLARGKPTAIVGEPGEGKSLSMVELAARITTARGFPEGNEPLLPPSSVLMLNSEDGEGDTIKPRFLLAGGDESRLLQLKLPPGVQFHIDDDRDVKQLDEQLALHPEIVCLMIDPVLQHCQNEKEQDVRRGIFNLLEVLKRRNVAWLYAAHFNKVSGKNLSSPLDKLSGAKAWSGVPRIVLAIMRGTNVDAELGKPRHHLILGKANIGDRDIPTQDFTIQGHTMKALRLDAQPRIKWLGESKVTMAELLEKRKPKKPKEESTVEEVCALLQAELQDQPRPASDIYKVLKDMGCGHRTVERARALLILNGGMARPENVGGSWYWKRGTQPPHYTP
jgi:AAA domain